MKYAYQATSSNGETVSGVIESVSLADAILQLQSDGFDVHSIQQQTIIQSPSSLSQSTAERVDTAIKQNTHLVDRLKAIALELPRGASRREVGQLIGSLKQGDSIQSLIDKHPKWATPLIGATLNADHDDMAFSSSLEQLLHRHEERSAIWRVLLYPAIVLSLALLVLLMLGWFVIPTFSQMFKEFGLKLPVPTKLTLGFSDSLVTNPLGTLLVSLIAIAGPVGLIWFWTRFRLTARIFGFVPIKDRPQGLAELTGQTANLLSAGLPLDEALRLVRCDREPFYEDVAGALVRHLRTNTSPPNRFLPPNVLYALGFSSSGGTIEREPNAELLRSLSKIYRSRSGHQDPWWVGTVSGLAIIVVGMIVGWIVLSLILPLVSLISGLA